MKESEDWLLKKISNSIKVVTQKVYGVVLKSPDRPNKSSFDDR